MPRPDRTLIGSSAHACIILFGDSQCETFYISGCRKWTWNPLEMYHVKSQRATVTWQPVEVFTGRDLYAQDPHDLDIYRTTGTPRNLSVALSLGASHCSLRNESDDNLTTTTILQQWHVFHRDWLTPLRACHCSSSQIKWELEGIFKSVVGRILCRDFNPFSFSSFVLLSCARRFVYLHSLSFSNSTFILCFISCQAGHCFFNHDLVPFYLRYGFHRGFCKWSSFAFDETDRASYS